MTGGKAGIVQLWRMRDVLDLQNSVYNVTAMHKAKTYMAGSVPRFLRQSKLSHLPYASVIGSHAIRADNGSSLYFDIIMLPLPEFQRMRSYVGLQHVNTPVLQPAGDLKPSFVITNAKQVTAPADEPNPEEYAKNYFLLEFGLIKPEDPV
jgi:hypothetical protein